jgi:hypothetical protein
VGTRSVSVAELRAECVNLERATLAAGLATETDLVPHRPGGKENDRKDARGWLRYYAVLHRKHARGEFQASADSRLRADAAVMAALRDEPIRVDLIEPVPWANDTLTSHLLVYPKSLDALLQAHALDRQIAWLIQQADRIDEAGTRGMPRASELHRRVLDTISYTYGLLVWIMTSPGPEMPYTVGVGGDPELPTYVTSIHPIDLPQIAAAAQRHHARLTAVQALLDHRPQADGGRRPSWSSFMGSLAIELDDDSVQLTKHRSLASLLASVQLNADANRYDGDDDKKAESATHPPAGNLA